MTRTFSTLSLSYQQTLESDSCLQVPFQRLLQSGSPVIYNLKGQLSSPPSKVGLAETQTLSAEK